MKKTTVNIWKFSNTACDFEKIAGSIAMKIRNKIDRGEKLDRFDKNFITEHVNNNTFSRSGIPVMGWMISFSDVLKTYLVKYESTRWEEIRAMDKTSLRAIIDYKIYDIIER